MPLPLDRRKKLPLNNNDVIRMGKNIVENKQHKRPLKPDGISLARIKHESVNRHQMIQNIRFFFYLFFLYLDKCSQFLIIFGYRHNRTF